MQTSHGTILIVGANRGIGLAMASQLAARGERVIATCRAASPELRALGVEIIDGVDTASSASIATLKQRLGDRTVAVLVVAAGLLESDDLASVKLESVRRQIEVNALGPLAVTEALLDRVADGGKIAFVTSRMGSIGDNTSGGYYGYRMSKAALNMAGRSLAHDLRGRGIAVVLLHPGFVQTAMTGHRGDLTAEQSAAQLIARIDGLTLSSTGQFFHANGQTLPW